MKRDGARSAMDGDVRYILGGDEADFLRQHEGHRGILVSVVRKECDGTMSERRYRCDTCDVNFTTTN